MTAVLGREWRDLRSKARDAEEKRDFSNAEALYRQALDVIETTTGPATVASAQILLSLGDCYEMQGRIDDAKTAYKRARLILEKLA